MDSNFSWLKILAPHLGWPGVSSPLTLVPRRRQKSVLDLARLAREIGRHACSLPVQLACEHHPRIVCRCSRFQKRHHGSRFSRRCRVRSLKIFELVALRLRRLAMSDHERQGRITAVGSLAALATIAVVDNLRAHPRRHRSSDCEIPVSLRIASGVVGTSAWVRDGGVAVVACGERRGAQRRDEPSGGLGSESVRITKRLLQSDKPDVLQVIDEES
jgi:hypothetical protein